MPGPLCARLATTENPVIQLPAERAADRLRVSWMWKAQVSANWM